MPLALTLLLIRGAFAFHYDTPVSEVQLRGLARFNIIVTHEPLPRAQVDALHAKGTKLLLYEWSVAFYDTRASAWQKSLIGTDALLNATPLRGGVGASDADAWYFDPATDAQRVERAQKIAGTLRDIGYDGIFLDTTTAESVHPDALAEFRKRHPRDDYDAQYARFLARLRRELGRKLIFTNQGYRSPDHYLPYADWDLTESFITYLQKGRFVVRPWNDPRDPWNSTRYLFEHLIAPAHAKYPRVRFAHLNYADAPDESDQSIVRRAVATAKMFDGDAYVAAVDSDLYFLDLGKPNGPRVDVGDASYRKFTKGMVAVNGGRVPLVIDKRTTVAPGDSLVKVTR